MKEITVTSKKYGIHIIAVDNEDYDWLMFYTWSIYKHRNTFYAATNKNISKSVHKSELMHRLIMHRHNNIQDKLIDHKDHNGINNQKQNLRICTNSDNQRNRIVGNIQTLRSASKYKGVQRNPVKTSDYGWMSIIWLDSKPIRIGVFRDEITAAKTYDRVVTYLFGNLAATNFDDVDLTIDIGKFLKRRTRAV